MSDIDAARVMIEHPGRIREVTDVLARYAPADASGEALATVESELGAPVAALYGSFHRPVMASASVAEVHKATLKDHTRVVVKVVHHDAAARVRADLDVMRVVAEWLERSDADLERYRLVELVDGFAAMLRDALDLRTEAANLEAFGAKFADDPRIAIPHAYRELSSASVLTMTREEGRSPTGREAVERAGWEVDDLVAAVADVYLTMIFRDGLFHADPHPGNLLLTPDHRIAILDFGDVGRVLPSRRAQLARMGLALVFHDDRSLADEILAVTDPSPETDLDAARRDLSDWVAGSLYGSIDEMDVPALADSFAEVMRRHACGSPTTWPSSPAPSCVCRASRRASARRSICSRSSRRTRCAWRASSSTRSPSSSRERAPRGGGRACSATCPTSCSRPSRRSGRAGSPSSSGSTTRIG